MTSRILLYGVGAIGQAVAQAAATRRDLSVTAAVDPALAGRDLGDVSGAWRGVRICASLGEALARAGADCAIHATGSHLAQIAPQLIEIADAGLSVVSSCEELCVPSAIDPALARQLDARAVEKGVAILAAGVNPGLVMEALPVLVATACIRVDSIRVERSVDLARRRPQLQRKLGVGMDPAAFRALAAQPIGGRELGHVGLSQSMAAIARALDLKLGGEEKAIEPIVKDGTVIGAREIRRAQCEGTLIELVLRMEMSPEEEFDEVRIEGDPPIRVTVPGGIHGDRATVGRLLNAVRYARKVQGLNPGTFW